MRTLVSDRQDAGKTLETLGDIVDMAMAARRVENARGPKVQTAGGVILRA